MISPAAVTIRGMIAAAVTWEETEGEDSACLLFK